MTNWISPALFWFLVGLFCMIGEFAAPGVVVVFFGVGAWTVALLVLFVDMPLSVQALLFTGVSIASLLLLRRRLRLDGTGEDASEDFVGSTAVVTETVVRDKPGRVKFKGSTWMARTNSDVPLAAGRQVRIMSQESLMLEVEPIPSGRSRRDLSAGPPDEDTPAA